MEPPANRCRSNFIQRLRVSNWVPKYFGGKYFNSSILCLFIQRFGSKTTKKNKNLSEFNKRIKCFRKTRRLSARYEKPIHSLCRFRIAIYFDISVKRHKLTNCNIKLETLSAAVTQSTQSPKTSHQDNRSSNQTAAYTHQLEQFELPPQTFQCAPYAVEQDNYQMYNMPATNAYPHDNRQFASMPQPNHIMNRDLNPNYNQSSFNDGAHGPIGNYPMMPNYQMYMPPPTYMPKNGCYQNENNLGAEYLATAPMMDCNENINAHSRHSEIDKNFNADPVIHAFTNYLDGPVENIEGNLSNSLTMISLGNNN